MRAFEHCAYFAISDICDISSLLQSPDLSLPRPSDRDVCVCWVDVSAVTADDASAWVSRLPQTERDRYARYRHQLAAHQFLVGRLLIRGWLESLTGTSAAAWELREGERGRPEIASPPSPWSFNLAHSGNLVACVLSSVSDVGVDLEDLDRRPLTRDLARRFCAPAEVADIEQQPEAAQTHRFLTYWTLKEAYLKARGLGIAVHLADLEFNLAGEHPSISFRESLEGTSRDWAFGLFQPTPRYLLSVAVPQPAGSPRPDIAVSAVTLDALTR
ncbi:MAG: 4'-phosphopantetheinyl transferase superfamily protein [Acidobacteria bacterium]|nr:4'-phosphopantetheinyl transferase superfamily protein [Acidobacteriota bacterium]